MKTKFSKSLTLKGELRASEDITLEGRIDGPVSCESHSVVISQGAEVTGNIVARDITIFGRLAGQLIATEVVDIRPEAVVTGQVISRRFILNEGASFNGRAAPQQLEAALRISRYNQKQKESEPEVRP